MTNYEKFFNFIKKPQILSLFFITLILGYFFLDKSIALSFHQLNLSQYKLLSVFTLLGKWWLYVVLFAVLGFIFRYPYKNPLYEKRAWFLLGCVLIPNILNAIIKVTLSRARPELLFLDGSFGFHLFQFKDAYWSFPSGHATTTAALLMGIWLLFPRYLWGMLVLAILVSASRVMLTKHYLTDVLFGFYMGLLVVGYYSSYFSSLDETK